MATKSTTKTKKSTKTTTTVPTSATSTIQQQSDDVEYELVGVFLLELYHRQLINSRNDWLISKKQLRCEFNKFLNNEKNSQLVTKFLNLHKICDIFSSLHRTHFIITTTREIDYFRIRFVQLLKYRNKKLKECDNLQVNSDLETVLKEIETTEINPITGVVVESKESNGSTCVKGKSCNSGNKGNKGNKGNSDNNSSSSSNNNNTKSSKNKTASKSSNSSSSSANSVNSSNNKRGIINCFNKSNCNHKNHNGINMRYNKNNNNTQQNIWKVVDDAESAKNRLLEYQGTQVQTRRPDYNASRTGCFICQRNFLRPEDMDKHMEYHSDKSDFQCVKELKKIAAPIFRISYKFQKNSPNIYFKLKVSLPATIIEKIIIVQAHSLYFVHNALMPLEMSNNKELTFYVDSHTFVRYMEHPFVIIGHSDRKPEARIVEQHHFLYTKEVRIMKIEENMWKYLPSARTFKPKFDLPQYLPSAKISISPKEDCSMVEWMPMYVQRKFEAYIKNGKVLTPDNVRHVMCALLQIEDIHVITEYSNLIQYNAQIRKFGDVYSLQLKTPRRTGRHIENVLSLNDEVLLIPEKKVQPTWELLLKTTNFYYDSCKRKMQPIFGEIERVSNGRVIFMCPLKLSERQLYTIIFRPARLIMRYQYYALELFANMSEYNIRRFLFPDVVMPRSLPTIDMILHNTHVAQNPEQLQAVRNIVSGPRKDATYIIFGPPGTGKTITIVEAILQLYRLRPYTKILVTSASNGACDEIAKRLCLALAPFGDRHAIVRIYSRAAERRWENIDDILLEHSNMYSEHFYPDVQAIHAYRIVLCTLSVVGKLSTGWFGKNELGADAFTHVFVDEAAAATEIETYMGIMCTLSNNANLIISGDHKQLGAILHSQRAAELGLSVSLLERLLNRECYCVDEGGDYDRTVQTRLCRNYRSHPEIVNLYNHLYYNNSLIAAAKKDVTELCKKWHRSTNTSYPIVFHSVFGTAVRETSSMSLCNPRELEVVLDYVMDFMYFGIQGESILQTDIGIISPYKKQCLRIQEELNLRKWHQIDTGSVESFQGKEKSIIIVSFVRSFRSTLGFLENTRRLNVMLSRAKSLIILIGNPRTLSLNADFKHIIDECRSHNTLVGSTFFDIIHPPIATPTAPSAASNASNSSSTVDQNNDQNNDVSHDGLLQRSVSDIWPDDRANQNPNNNNDYEAEVAHMSIFNLTTYENYANNFNTIFGDFPQVTKEQIAQQQLRIPQSLQQDPVWCNNLNDPYSYISDDSTSSCSSSLLSQSFNHEADQYQILPQLAAIYSSPSNILKFNSSIYSIQVPTLRPVYQFSLPIFALSDSKSSETEES